jgi:hypothetical protein
MAGIEVAGPHPPHCNLRVSTMTLAGAERPGLRLMRQLPRTQLNLIITQEYTE